MRIIDRFTIEHEVFLQELEAIDALGPSAPTEALVAAVRTLSIPLLVHAENEEHALFPDLEAQLGRDAAPLAVLVKEHETIHGYIEQITAKPSRDEVIQVLAAFARLLLEHIAKEEEVLFPLSARILGEERLVELDREIPRVYGAPRVASRAG